jgi:hypothetical protein
MDETRVGEQAAYEIELFDVAGRLVSPPGFPIDVGISIERGPDRIWVSNDRPTVELSGNGIDRQVPCLEPFVCRKRIKELSHLDLTLAPP